MIVVQAIDYTMINTPIIGGPATISVGAGDAYAGKVVSISKSGAKVVVEYTTSGGLNGEREIVFRDGKGRYYLQGRHRVFFHAAETYRNPCSD